MKHRISRRAFLRGCTLLAASAAVGSLTSCGGTNAKDSSLPQLIVGSDTYPPYIYLNNDGVPAGIDVEIATEAFRRMGYAARFEPIDWEQKTALVESGTIDCIWGCFSMDGRGYPDGLKGDEIPSSAHLVSLADVYDALTSERCYKKAFSHEKAVQMILNGECGAFNPLLLQCLTDMQTDLKIQLQQRTQ